MSLVDLQDRYDSFQRDAVRAIVRDFTAKLNGRYLLVIPTGGGKTYTAAKAICQLFIENRLNRDSETVLWIAHRKELKDQAEDTFKKLLQGQDTGISLGQNIRVAMLDVARKQELSNPQVKIVVIDEAHHGAANSYQIFFDKRDVGVLGLTATPTRHDGKPLEFERESYSIGFPDLVKKGIILKPEIQVIRGGSFAISSITDEKQLEALNTDERNGRIVQELLSHSALYHKVIVYVGTIAHAKQLYKVLLGTPLKDMYESISYIAGGENSRNQDRTDYITKEKSFKRSIIVNVQVLTEGYDDPMVNTVVMATPSRSKLYYMQALGRAIRQDPGNLTKKAHVVEVVDDLPNIRYRIDNRWLYSDISDALEPAVMDFTYSTPIEFAAVLNKIYTDFKVIDSHRAMPVFNEDYRYSLLLFKKYRGENEYNHYPLLIDNETRTKISNAFNFISERMSVYRSKNVNWTEVYNTLGVDNSAVLGGDKERRVVYDAMNNASAVIELQEGIIDYVKNGTPWITFISLNYRKRADELSSELQDFLRECVNREDLIELLITRNYEAGSILIRLPLPLQAFIGKIITRDEFGSISAVIDNLQQIKQEKGQLDHRVDVDLLISNTVLPIEVKHSDSLILIAREALRYFIQLS